MKKKSVKLLVALAYDVGNGRLWKESIQDIP